MTATSLAVAVVAALLQYAAPAVVPALARDPDGLANVQWWRLFTPLLVQTLGWYQVVANLVTLAIVGLVAERLLGRWRWAVLFVGGTAGGQAAAYAWHEPGGGDSIAICGLAAGVAVTLLAGRAPVPRLAAHVVVYYSVALTGWGFGGTLAAGLGCLVTAAFLHGLPRVVPVSPERFALAGTVVLAVALGAAHDLHGASWTSGMFVMAVLLTAERIIRRDRVPQSSRQRRAAPPHAALRGGNPPAEDGR